MDQIWTTRAYVRRQSQSTFLDWGRWESKPLPFVLAAIWWRSFVSFVLSVHHPKRPPFHLVSAHSGRNRGLLAELAESLAEWQISSVAAESLVCGRSTTVDPYLSAPASSTKEIIRNLASTVARPPHMLQSRYRLNDSLAVLARALDAVVKDRLRRCAPGARSSENNITQRLVLAGSCHSRTQTLTASCMPA
jgi:hypothetical protein